MHIANHQRTTWCVLFCLAFFLRMPAAFAAEDQEVQYLSTTARASLKTIAFQSAANLSDSLIFSAIVGADATTSAIFFAANTASAMAVYLPYELAWDSLGPSPEVTTAQIVVVKTVGYQLITSIRNLVLSYAFSGTLLSSVSFMAAVAAVDTAVYAVNEYVWDIFSPRPPSNKPSTAVQ